MTHAMTRIFLWTGILLLISCNTRKNGCLDIEADNFDLSAERACDDCCTYPDVGIILSQKWGDRNFSTSDTLYDINGQAYRITDLKYLLADWHWISIDGNSYTVDPVSLPCPDSPVTFTDDFALIDTRQFTYTLGSFRQAVDVATITFAIGTEVNVDCADQTLSQFPKEIAMSSPLWQTSAQKLKDIRLIVQPDLTIDQTDTIYIDLTQQFSLAFPFSFVKGMNGQWPVTVDYQKWFANVNLQSPATFEQNIIAGLPGSFSKTQ